MKFAAKRVVILAAGRGSRLAPFTDRTPKPLLVYDGKPIIENIIEKVRLAGIGPIVVVVGYKAEQFDYLKEMYSELSIVYNPLWNRGNNVLSVYAAIDFFKDALVINGDAIVKADVFKKVYERTTMYADRAIGFSKEWELVLGGNGFLAEINIAGGSDILQHREVTFICADDFDRFKAAVRFKVDIQRDLDSYFEFCLLPWCEIAVLQLPKGVIFDLDDRADWIKDPLASKAV